MLKCYQINLKELVQLKIQCAQKETEPASVLSTDISRSSSEQGRICNIWGGSHLQTEDAEIFSPTPNKSVCGVLKKLTGHRSIFFLLKRYLIKGQNVILISFVNHLLSSLPRKLSKETVDHNISSPCVS